MKQSLIRRPLPLLLLVLASCASAPVVSHPTPSAGAGEHGDDQTGAEEREERENKIADLTHKLEIARIQLDLAVLAGTRSEIEQERRVAHAQEEVEMAQGAIENFTTLERPSQLGRAQLSLQGAREAALEADEELQQIELMYKDQNLADMTAEFVIQRGKRRAQRAARRIEFQELDLRSLETHKLPLQERKLTLALTKAQESLEGVQADTAKTTLNRTLKLSQAQMALEQATRSLAEAQSEDDDS